MRRCLLLRVARCLSIALGVLVALCVLGNAFGLLGAIVLREHRAACELWQQRWVCRVVAAKEAAAEAAAAAGAAAVTAARTKATNSILHINNERFMTAEALFTPTDIGVDQAGVCETIANSIRATHAVFRPLLSRNVLLIGGTSACPGFKERVAQDLRPLLDDMYDLAVNQTEAPEETAWRGGSIFAASPAFAQLAVTRGSYEEEGMARTMLRLDS